MHNFKSTIEELDSNVWSYCFFVPKEISSQLIDGDNRRVVCKLNNQIEFQGALMGAGERGYFINTNQEIRKKLKLEVGSTVQVSLTKDNSKYGIYLAPEFEELLEQDIEGSEIFHTLTMGKQRNLLHIVGKLKSSDKRIEKGIIILEYLKSVNGKLDFKELNEAFKNSRFK